MSAKTKNGENLVYNYVAGATANTDIAIADPDDSQDIALGDELKHVLEFPDAGSVPVDRTSIASITSAGNIRLTASTATSHLQVVYRRNN